MNLLYSKVLALLALTACTTLALADPPGRVGRVSYTEGEVVLRNNTNDDSTTAALNWPITSQNVLYTGANSRAELRIGSAAVRVGSNANLEIEQLDDMHFILRLNQGSATVRIKDPELAHDFELDTPQGRVLLLEPSRFRVDTGYAPESSALNVFSGGARFEAADSSLTVRSGRHAEITDGEIRMSDRRINQVNDDFDAWNQARDQRDERSVSTRYISQETTGYEDLDNNGNWQMSADYGAVWYPTSVASGWAPYRDGRWAWVEPWGWTWVDSAPWGYAPFHYGRWLWFNQRWCWAPGTMVARPVWAPALVGWVGGRNWNVGFSFGAAPAVGWFPLAPHEVFVPAYSVSPTYLRQVNITHVTNITNVTNVNGIYTVPPQTEYRNRSVHNAVTVVPHDQFTGHKTNLISAMPVPRDKPQRLQNAPISALAPATIEPAHVRVLGNGPAGRQDTGRPESSRPTRADGPAQMQRPEQIQAAPTPAAPAWQQNQGTRDARARAAEDNRSRPAAVETMPQPMPGRERAQHEREMPTVVPAWPAVEQQQAPHVVTPQQPRRPEVQERPVERRDEPRPNTERRAAERETREIRQEQQNARQHEMQQPTPQIQPAPQMQQPAVHREEPAASDRRENGGKHKNDKDEREHGDRGRSN